MDSNQQENSQFMWNCIGIKRFLNGKPLTTMLFDTYIVIFINDFLVETAHDSDEDHEGEYYEEERQRTYELRSGNDVTVLAVDLRDNSVQEAQIRDRSFFFDKSPSYTLTKYGDNQIVKYGRIMANGPLMSLITIESFYPFTLKYEDITTQDTPKIYQHTAHISNDFLYVYGGVNRREEESNVWRFGLKNHTWENLKPVGECPGDGLGSLSFLYNDHLYIHGGESLISTLDLKSMKWKHISPEGGVVLEERDWRWMDLDQSIYQDNLLLVCKDRLECWNMSTNSFRTLHKESQFANLTPLIVYKNRIFAFDEDEDMICMNIIDLKDIGLKPEETEEDKRFKSLFMNQEGSDVTIKVQDKLIPAHKEVLIKRSKYFAGLFNSGMSESRENVIEIQDCDSDLFQEFLRFSYIREAPLNEDLAMKLIKLSDKYVQTELSEKCLDFLKFTIKSDNVFKRLDFACEQNLDQLKDFCKNFLKRDINKNNILSLLQFLEKQTDQDFQEMKAHVVNFIVNNFQGVYYKDEKNWQFYEDFLIKNVEISTISLLVNFIHWKDSEIIDNNKMFYCKKQVFEYFGDEIKKSTVGLKQACLTFAQRNFKKLREKDICQEFPNSFLMELAFIVIPTSNPQ